MMKVRFRLVLVGLHGGEGPFLMVVFGVYERGGSCEVRGYVLYAL